MSTLFYKMTQFPVVNLAASCCATPTTKDDNWHLLSMRSVNVICRELNIRLPTKETAELFAREYSEKKLLAWPNIGKTAIVNIRTWMASYGLHLESGDK